MRYVTIQLNNRHNQEFTIYDAHIVDAPLVIPNKNQVDSFKSSTDVVFHEYGKSGKFERYTANHRHILYPIRELYIHSIFFKVVHFLQER